MIVVRKQAKSAFKKLWISLPARESTNLINGIMIGGKHDSNYFCFAGLEFA